MKRAYTLVEALLAIALVAVAAWPVASALFSSRMQQQATWRQAADGLAHAALIQQWVHSPASAWEQESKIAGVQWRLTVDTLGGRRSGHPRCYRARAIRQNRDTLSQLEMCLYE